MSRLNDYSVHLMSSETALDLVVKYHYLHRKCSTLYCFGLYDIRGIIKGVCIYGMPASRFLQKGVCGEKESNNVMELTRLWIDDSVGKNAESYFVGNTLRLLRKMKTHYDIIVSFSDTGAGHLGYIYQACNFYYTGQNHIQKDWIVDGKILHNRHFIDRFGSVAQAKSFYGDRMSQIERSIKHRYIYFNCDRRRKKYLLSKLQYDILPYPKELPIGCTQLKHTEVRETQIRGTNARKLF